LLKNAKHSVAKVQTVDASQGDEHPVILYCSVCANEFGRIGFVGDARRLNVAITRAMEVLIMLGDQSTLCKVDKESTWNPLFNYFAAQGWIRGREGKRRSADVEVSTRNVAARKKQTESVPYSRRVTLGEADSKSLLAQACTTVSLLLRIPTFRMLMTALEHHHQRRWRQRELLRRARTAAIGKVNVGIVHSNGGAHRKHGLALEHHHHRRCLQTPRRARSLPAPGAPEHQHRVQAPPRSLLFRTPSRTKLGRLGVRDQSFHAWPHYLHPSISLDLHCRRGWTNIC